MEEYSDFILLPTLYEYLNKNAPHIELKVKNVPLFGERQMLEAQEIELGIGLLQHSSELQTLLHETLFRERMVCVAAADHPLFKKPLKLKDYLNAKHVCFVTFQESAQYIVDLTLENMGYKRNVVLKVAHVVPALYAVEKSDLVATIPEGMAKEACRLLNVKICECPFSISDVAFVQMWHPWTSQDSGCRWLRDVIVKIAAGINQQMLGKKMLAKLNNDNIS